MASERTDMADERTTLAQQRTELAQHRTLLANERTFSAWIRTGLAAVVAGLGIVRLLDVSDAAWLPRVLGALFIVGGVSAFFIGYGRHRQVNERLGEVGLEGTPWWVVAGLSFLLLIIALLALVLVFHS
jgi:putative membrane protein